MTLTVTVSDLFDGQRYLRVANTPALSQTYERSVTGRVAWIGLTWSLGAAKQDQSAKYDYESGDAASR